MHTSSECHRLRSRNRTEILESRQGFANIPVITIPASVEVLCERCFVGCRSLSRVTFAAGSRLKRIENWAFSGCQSLKEIEIPASVEELGPRVFSGCDVTGLVIAPENRYYRAVGAVVLSYDGSALAGVFRNIAEIEIPASVAVLCEGCFGGDYESSCRSLSRVTFAAGSCLKRIEMWAFSRCRSLKEIEIPASVEVLCESCFVGRTSLSRVTFAAGSCLKRIEKEAFSGCESLKEIEIPAGVEELGPGVFSGCDVTGLVIAPENRYYRAVGPVVVSYDGNALAGVFRNIAEIEIPASVERLCERCFVECESLSRLTFAAGSCLKRIEKMAFSGCRSLKEIEIPASVEVLCERCFDRCKSLSRLTFASGSCLKQIEKEAFY